MIVLDATIVNVALPSIRADLGFSEASLAWVVNAYLLTFGGFLLLGGRLGDLFGHRRLFLVGIALFTARLARLRALDLAAPADRRPRGAGPRRRGRLRGRALAADAALQGAGRAGEGDGLLRLRAAGGGSIGVLLGGVLTDALSWHWIFLVNIPVGDRGLRRSRCRCCPPTHGGAARGTIDVAGAVTVTSALILAVYAIVNGNGNGWTSAETLGLLGAAASCSASSS